MSNEELYDTEVSAQDFASEDNTSNEFEVDLSRRSPKGDVFIQVYPRTRHWLRVGVRPEGIINENKEEGVFSFVKRMKDPDYDPAEGTRYITFRCNIVLGELEIEMSFTHIEVSYQNENGEIGPGSQVYEGDEECDAIKSVFDKVIDNLAAYLSKQ
ncbi:MAG: hypothetical protein II847_04075 [Ruminobacter sp.]|jgi:hypothetical protein|uniref:Uncharacterized protein n=1 Tax=Ruminobacter amylophilus TaxID=867 RepID=A0A662ZK64_9GAMM|nr:MULTISPECIES: hypothetical protein [Ruminobacter]MBQ3775286.1 hypothetical protein [Ruminobacter sp.]MBQ3883441.1 hypothetical protein [Succinivibrio sp.]SFP57305.1 hypothetical protein SAMN02910344_01762 [Ruminobacter amylophilus]